MSGWTNDIPAHLTRPRDQGVIEAPRVPVAGMSSWATSGSNGVISRPIKAGGGVLRGAAVTVPAHVVIQCAPAAPVGPLAGVVLPAVGESFAQEWARLRSGGKS